MVLPPRIQSPRKTRKLPVIGALTILFGLLGSQVVGQSSAPPSPAPALKGTEKPKSIGGFGEAPRGDVPEGTLELMTVETDKSIHGGLGWLAQAQKPDGSYGEGTYRGNIAVTSLAGLALMSSGSSPGRGPYGRQIEKALAYVMENTSPSGFVAVATASTNGPMYSHGFGTLFLAEAYGMTHRAEIREKLQKAVRLIIDCQNNEGGWRYQPIRVSIADVSVTICQINALRAARNAGLYVPRETVDACLKYVKQCQNPDGGFRYMSTPGSSAFPRSAAGVVALQSAGEYDSKQVRDGIAYLGRSRNEIQRGGRFNHYFYGHYYAAQAMWIRGGEDWNNWYPEIRNELIRRQSPNGSWKDSVCDEYGTAMALIVLQIPNNYLPIFQR